jgi:hypothetical protein
MITFQEAESRANRLFYLSFVSQFLTFLFTGHNFTLNITLYSRDKKHFMINAGSHVTAEPFCAGFTAYVTYPQT